MSRVRGRGSRSKSTMISWMRMTWAGRSSTMLGQSLTPPYLAVSREGMRFTHSHPGLTLLSTLWTFLRCPSSSKLRINRFNQLQPESILEIERLSQAARRRKSVLVPITSKTTWFSRVSPPSPWARPAEINLRISKYRWKVTCRMC